MLTQGIEVMKYVRASAGRAKLAVQFEDVNQPRHDGSTIYLPRITSSTTLQELKQLMASVDHEVAHDRFSSFDVLKAKKVDPRGLLMFVWNFLEDSRINNIEANEYRGFKENWDECSAELVGTILTKAAKATGSSLAADMATTMLYWEAGISALNFPLTEMVAHKHKPNKTILDVLNNFSDRLVSCHETLDKKLGTQATYELALDILKKLGENEEELLKKYPESFKEGEGDAGDKKDGKGDEPATKSKAGDDSKGSDESKEKAKEDEYKVITIKLSEEEIDKYSTHVHLPSEDGSEMGKLGINLEPVKTSGNWDLTDFDKFIVVDYPRQQGKRKYFNEKSAAHWFLEGYKDRVGDKVVAQENFAQQVRRLIQIRAKVQRQYGVKKGKLDQARLSRICFNAPGFNERIFKNKIENKTLDASIQVLVDMSGSMSGEKAMFALAATVLVNEVCSVLNLPVEILGFTDDGPIPVMFVYKAFNDLHIEPDALKESFALSSSFMHGNPDGENILWAHNRLVKRKEKKKLLIVMSDGSPAASKGMRGIDRFTEKVIREIEDSKNVDIYGLGLLSDSVRYYYKANSVVENPQDIPIKLLELIERKILT